VSSTNAPECDLAWLTHTQNLDSPARAKMISSVCVSFISCARELRAYYYHLPFPGLGVARRRTGTGLAQPLHLRAFAAPDQITPATPARNSFGQDNALELQVRRRNYDWHVNCF
jgi:hypothetical protein